MKNPSCIVMSLDITRMLRHKYDFVRKYRFTIERHASRYLAGAWIEILLSEGGIALARKLQHDGVMSAVIYARYSSSAQKDASIEQQIDKATEFAKQNGICIVDIYSDRAKTGKTDKRSEFQRMLKDATKGKFKYVIAWKSSRIGRNMLQAMLNEAKLQAAGVRCLYVEEDFDDTAAGRFALRSMMNVNQFHIENMAEDIQRGLEDNAKQCKVNGKLSYGFVKGPDARYALDDFKISIVQEIFFRLENNESEVDIYEDLNRRGIPSPSGGRWNKNSLHAIATNERYTGVYIWGNIRIEGGIPAAIGKEQFRIVQEKRKIKKAVRGRHRDNGDYMLTGKLYCGHCGGHMVGMSGTSKLGTPYYYYACQTRRNEKTCPKKPARREWLERMVALTVKQQILRPDVMEWIADSVLAFQKKCEESSDLSMYQDRLTEIKASIANVIKAIEIGIITETTKSRLVELEKDKHTYEAKIVSEKSMIPKVTREEVLYWLESFQDGDVEDKEFQKKLIDSFIVAVYLYDDKLKIVFDYSEDKNSVVMPITLEDVESEDMAECSYNPSIGVP